MNAFNILYLSLIPYLAIAQQNIIEGKVKDEQGNPITFCAVANLTKGNSTLTNITGEFKINSAQYDSLAFSSLGFQSARWQVKSMNQNLVIVLKSKSYPLNEISINAFRAEKLLRAAILKFEDNYPNIAYTYNGFYRQSHQENNRWVRLIEADVEVYDEGYGKNELLRLNHLRRSRVYERNKDIHGDHLAELFLENTVHYPSKYFTRLFNLDRYQFSFDTTFSNDSIARVEYYHSTPAELKTLKGFIDINLTDTAIVRTETNSIPNKNFINTTSYSSNWQFKSGKVVVYYKKQANKYYLHQINFSYSHQIYNPIFKTVDFIVNEHFDLWINNIKTASGVDKNSFHYQSNSYVKQYDYEPDFWNNYKPTLIHPLLDNIELDLTKEISLQEQFAE